MDGDSFKWSPASCQPPGTGSFKWHGAWNHESLLPQRATPKYFNTASFTMP
jgi:hypothetical protein